MRLHVHEWGDPDAPAVVCLHGVTAHGERFKQLAEERWAARFHIVAPDLRGHGRSGWEPPWTFETHVADIVETIDALGLGRPHWVGHSFGGRLVLELAARHPERIDRAVLLDPAFDILPHVAEFMAEVEGAEQVVDSAEASLAERHDAGVIDLARALADVPLHHDVLPDTLTAAGHADGPGAPALRAGVRARARRASGCVRRPRRSRHRPGAAHGDVVGVRPDRRRGRALPARGSWRRALRRSARRRACPSRSRGRAPD
ncbi:MAG: alpha/beta hydrolase [Actinobacteria bacterium]|nr:MAG: alpha/beta hydrolase [Actinomycetota bacterium]